MKVVEVGTIVDLSIDNRALTACVIDPKEYVKRKDMQEITTTSPLGQAIIGRMENEVVSYNVMTDTHTATILKVYENIKEYENNLEKSKTM